MKTTKTYIELLACILLASCATAAPPAPATQNHTLECKEALNAWMDCVEKNGAQRCDENGRMQAGK